MAENGGIDEVRARTVASLKRLVEAERKVARSLEAAAGSGTARQRSSRNAQARAVRHRAVKHDRLAEQLVLLPTEADLRRVGLGRPEKRPAPGSR